MHIVMVEASAPRSFDFIEELAGEGIEVSFLTDDLRKYASSQGFDRHKLASRVLEIPDLRDNENVAAAVRGRLGASPPDGVLCLHDHYLLAAACLARDLGVPHEPLPTVRMLTDKSAVRERLSAAGVGTLRWRCVRSAAEGLEAAAGIGYPVVIKPVDGRCSVDVTIAWTAEQAADVLPGTLERAYAKRLLVEEYVAGRDVAAQVIVQGGQPMLLGFSERIPSRPDNTVELGGCFPATFEQRGACRRFVLDIVRALGIQDSALHIELMVTATGPELIEVNGRMVGYVVPRQMSIALDRSIALDLVALCTGRPVPPVAEPVWHVALRNLCSERNGRVRSARLPAGLPAQVTDCHLAVRPGDRVVPTRHNLQRIGYVLAKGFTPHEAAAAADQASARIRDGLDIAEIPGGPGGGPGRDGTLGPHAVLLLDSGAGGPDPQRILDAAAAATGHVSVLWCGDQSASPALREEWERRYAGQWHEAPDEERAAAGFRELRAAGPVDAVVTFSPALAALRDHLTTRDGTAPSSTARDTGAGLTAPAARQHQGERPSPGCAVVSLVAGGTVAHLDILDDLGPDSGGHVTLRRPSALPADRQRSLCAAASRAVAASGATAGLVRCVFTAEEAAGAPVPEPVAVLPGLDEATRALHDAACPRGIVALTVSAALGRPAAPGREAAGRHRAGTAMLRMLAAPPGPFRVVRATTADAICDYPEVAYVRAPLAAGDVHAGPDPAVRLTFAVAAPDAGACQAAITRVESGLSFDHAALDRTHVLVLDRIGGATWTTDEGSPLLSPERFRVTVLTGAAPGAARGAAPPDVTIHADVFDHEAVARITASLHHTHPIHRIAAATERLLAPAARLRAHLGLPGDSSAFARSLLDKAEMKRLAMAAGIPHAAGGVVYEAADAHRLLDRYGTIVLKPRDLSGSQGVTVCAGDRVLRDWLRDRFVPGRYLAERWVSGPMCHIDALVHDGFITWDVSLYRRDCLAVTRGLPLSSQTVDDAALRRKAEVLLERVVSAWRMRSAVLHLEAFAEGEELVFCEVAGRPGGAGVIPAFIATRGIDLRHAKIFIDAGEDPRELRREPAAAHAGWTVHYSRGGVLECFDDSAVAERAYYRELRAEAGETLPRSAFSGTGLSTHVFTADSSAEIDRLITAAEQDIRIVMSA